MDVEGMIYSILKNHVASMVFVLDAKGKIVDSNSSFESYLADEFGGATTVQCRNITDYSPDICMSRIEASASSLNTKKSGNLELIFLNNRTIKFLCYKLLSDNNDKLFLLISNNDSVFADDIINALPGSIYWKDIDGRYIGTNRAVLAMAGFNSKDEILGKTDYELCWSEFADEWRDLDLEVMQTGQQVVREEYVRLHNGDLMAELTYKSPLINGEGVIIGIIGASLDITDLKETQQKLEVALEESRAAKKTQDAIIANFRHDYRTPFSGLTGMAKCMADLESDPEKKENLLMIYEGAAPLLEQFNAIISLSSSIEGSLPLMSKIMNCYEVLQEMVAIYRPIATVKNIALSVEVDPESWKDSQLGDDVRIKRILINIISNAFKFTKNDGAVRLCLKKEEIDDKKILAKFYIQDTGIGIPEQYVEKIFEPFFKITPSYNVSDSADSGAGAGLAIARQYARDIGAQLVCNSKSSDGALFVLAVPLEKSLISKEDVDY